MSAFVAPKRKDLPADVRNRVKKSQANFAINSLTSFKCQDHLADLAQTFIDIGHEFGKVDAVDLLYSRTSIKAECFSLDSNLGTKLKEICQSEYKAFTTDIWTSQSNVDSFLEMHIVFLKNFKLSSCQLFMVNFDKRHTGQNIKNEVLSQFDKFGIDLNTEHIFVTTDSASNMLSAFADFTNFRCICHRLSTCVEDAWEECKENTDIDFIEKSVSSLLNTISHKSDIQKLLPKKVVLNIFSSLKINCNRSVLFKQTNLKID